MRSVVAVAVSVLALSACGGVVTNNGAGTEGSGGTGAGGYNTWTQGSGSANVGGDVFVGDGGALATGGCCAAVPKCPNGDQQVASAAVCPNFQTCYPYTECCSTIWCATPDNTCTTIPTCAFNEQQIGSVCINGPMPCTIWDCPPGYSCHQVQACFNTVLCGRDTTIYEYEGGAPPPPPMEAGVACNPSSEYERYYLGIGSGYCATIDFQCPANTTAFFNACGCGCEQSSSCPTSITCIPPNSDCPSWHEKCPYSTFN